jgi:hypothetical protein
VEDGKLIFEEYDNNVSTPMNFEGQITSNDSQLEGKCGAANKLNRKFKISLS